MAEKPTVTIELTREQQLEILAATGLLVKTLQVDADSPDPGGAAAASIPLPKWLTDRPVSR